MQAPRRPASVVTLAPGPGQSSAAGAAGALLDGVPSDLVDDLRAALRRMGEQHGWLAERLDAALSARDEQAAVAAEARAEAAATRTEVARLGERAEQELARRLALESEVDALRSEVAAAEHDTELLRAELEVLRVENATLRGQRKARYRRRDS